MEKLKWVLFFDPEYELIYGILQNGYQKNRQQTNC